MKKIYLLVIVVVFSINANGQAPDWLWSKSIGGSGNDGINSIAVDGDGNIYTTGTFIGNADFDHGPGVFNLTSTDTTIADIFVCKTDSAGNFIWAKAFGGLLVEASRSIAFDPSGSGAVCFTGFFKGTADFDPGAGVFNMTSSIASNDIFICKLDTSGNFLWAKRMGGGSDDSGYSLTTDPSGNIYCIGFFFGNVDFDPGAGIFTLSASGNFDIFVSKYNSSGDLVWAKEIGGTSFEMGTCIARVPTGTDLYITGYFSGTVDFDPGAGTFALTSSALEDFFISKLDSAGNFIWAKSMGGINSENSSGIAADGAGNVYTIGRFSATVDFDPGINQFNLTSAGGDDVFISKLDNSGNFVWAKAFGGIYYELGNAIAVDFSGSVYTVGSFRGTVDFDPGAGIYNLASNGTTNSDMYISCLNSSGNFAWAKREGGVSIENCNAIVLDGSGHITMTGSFVSPTLTFGTNTLVNAGFADIFIAKLDTIVTTGIETISYDQFPINIFPNPFTDELTVCSPESGEVKIYDVTGRIVYTEKLTSFNAQLINANWQKGIYFIEVITEKGRVVKKIVKQ